MSEPDPDATGPDVTESRVREAYDDVAEAYHAAVADELEHKPLDRALLEAVAAMCADRKGATSPGYPVLDVGCGPGHTMRHLHARGLAVRGLDLSPNMVTVARRVNPGLDIEVGSALDLPYRAGSFSGVLSLYSIIHLPPQQVPDALAEFHRVLAPDGVLLLAFHAGNRPVHVDELFGSRVDLDGYLLDPDAVAAQLTAAGFTIQARLDRRPHAGLELETDRTHLLSRVPSGPHRLGGTGARPRWPSPPR